jgi:hypothetical protein
MDSDRDTLAGGLPHSEIPGSPIARISPGLFAACHVLHRLSVPRHPPDALLFALDHRIAVTGDAAPPPRTGPSPMPAPAQAGGGGLYEDTSLGHIRRKLCAAPPRQAKPPLRRKGGPSAACPRPVRLGHITTLSSPFNKHPAAVARGGVKQASPNVAHALVFGASPAPPGAARLPLSAGKSPALPVVPLGAAALRLSRGEPSVRRWWR